jgi:serine/threonine-protein kinase
VLNDTFEAIEVVGEGGFGVVYRGRHVGFDEQVAIKCLKLPAHFSEAEKAAFFDRLRDEGKLLVKLSRKTAGIVQALDIGDVTVKGTRVPYLALEWVDGVTLTQALAQRRAAREANPSVGAGAAFLRPIADALAVAHGQNVAHRDIKPDNLMRTADGSLKVLDFGIAKLLEVGPTGEAQTSAAAPVFTPGYGAPEQFEKRRGPTGPWTDVFSLALVFVEWVSGARAIVGEELIDLYKATTDPVRRPTLRALGVATSDDVEAVLLKALAIEPTARFQDAGAFMAALDRAVAAGSEADKASAPSRLDTAFMASASTEAFLSESAKNDAYAPTDALNAAQAEEQSAASPRTTNPIHLSQPPPSLATPSKARPSGGSTKIVAVVAGVAAVGALVFFANQPAPSVREKPAPETSPSGTIVSSSTVVSSTPTPPIPAPTTPELGLRTLAQYHDAPAALAGNPLTTTAWRAAAQSFEASCAADPSAARWCAAEQFCRGQVDFARDDHALALVSLGEERKENLHLVAVLLHVADVVENHRVEAVEDGKFPSQVAMRTH